MPPIPSQPNPYPEWDGIPRNELPGRFPFGIALLAVLKGRHGFPAGEILSDTSTNGAANHIRGGQIDTDEDGDTSVALWVPAFEDQRSEIRDREEPAEHTPLSEAERWKSPSWPSRPSAPRYPTELSISGSSRPTAPSCFPGTSTADTTSTHPNMPSATGSTTPGKHRIGHHPKPPERLDTRGRTLFFAHQSGSANGFWPGPTGF